MVINIFLSTLLYFFTISEYKVFYNKCYDVAVAANIIFSSTIFIRILIYFNFF